MVKKIFVLGLLFAVLAYATWSWVFQTGLYAVLIRWQATTFDTYFPTLTFAAIIILLLVPLYIFELAIGIGAKKVRPKTNMELSLDELNKRLRKKSRGFLLLTTVLVAAAGISFYLGQGAQGEDQPALSVDLNNVEDQHYWFKKVALNGVMLSKNSYSIITESSRGGYASETRYTPIAAPGRDKKPIHFVHIKTANPGSRIRAKLSKTGFVMPSVLPVLVRDTFEADGLLLADKVHVFGDSVVSLKMALYIAAGILGLIAFLFFVSVILMPIGNRRIIKEWHQVND